MKNFSFHQFHLWTASTVDCVPYPIKHVQCLVTNWRDRIPHMLRCKLFLLISSRLMPSCHELWRWMFVHMIHHLTKLRLRLCFILSRFPYFKSCEKGLQALYTWFQRRSSAIVMMLKNLWLCFVCVVQS